MYKNFYLLVIVLGLTFNNSQAQDYWQRISEKDLMNSEIKESYTRVSEHELYVLSIEDLTPILNQAPYRGSGITSNIEVTFPVSDETLRDFTIYKVNTLSEPLAEKFPNIKSFVGYTKDKKHTIRVTLTNQGFFGMVLSNNRTIYINPYTKTGDFYEVFKRENASRSQDLMSCLYDAEEFGATANSENALADVDESILREYRTAIAATGEYSQFHITQAGVTNGTDQEKKNAVLSAMTVTVDRVNQLYERDLSVTLTLVDGMDDIIYLNADTDPLNNDNTGTLINQSQTVIDSNIGSSNYDIGHTFSTGAGGLAQLFSVCNFGQKARGVTGINAPIGDAFDIDYVSHEFGHQFGGNHTFNSTVNSCAAQRSDVTAVEPGSGTTIMAYAGICPGQNVQGNSSPYFHSISINEIYNNVSTGSASNCPNEININNTAPTILPVPNYTIPYGTAFILNCETTDEDGDDLTFTWEQTDNEITTVPPSSNSSGGALFRSVVPSEDSERFFPKLSTVISGNLATTWEVIPTVAREMNFSVTVRDNNPLGGQSSREDVQVTVANTGPFLVTSQNTTGLSYDQNETVEITWDVAGTTANGINTQFVNILLSYNAGFEFNEVLAASVPNDGSQFVSMPVGTSSSISKIKIEAVDNVFYAINDGFFTITTNLGVNDNELDKLVSLYPNPSQGSFHINLSDDLTVENNNFNINVYDITGRRIYNKALTNNNQEVQLSKAQKGVYLVEVSNGKNKMVKKLIIE